MMANDSAAASPWVSVIGPPGSTLNGLTISSSFTPQLRNSDSGRLAATAPTKALTNWIFAWSLLAAVRSFSAKILAASNIDISWGASLTSFGGLTSVGTLVSIPNDGPKPAMTFARPLKSGVAARRAELTSALILVTALARADAESSISSLSDVPV